MHGSGFFSHPVFFDRGHALILTSGSKNKEK